MNDCQHREFDCVANVIRMEDSGKFMLEITVTCSECLTRFRFNGLKPGLDLNGIACSMDLTEARLSISPGAKIVPFRANGSH